MPDPSDERRERLKAAVQREPSMRVQDPMLADMVEIESPAPMGGADKDSTRLTMRIPGENTLLNLGAAEPSRSLDEGIHGWTDNHILFQTAAEQTMVNLGGKATNGGYAGSLGYASTSSVGYGMFTGGLAWHESVQSQYVITQTGEIVVRSHGGGSFLIQSDRANGTIAAGGDIAMGAKGAVKIVADAGVALETPSYGDDIAGTVDEVATRKGVTWTHAIMDQAQAVSGIVRGVVAVKDWPRRGEDGFVKHTLKGVPPILVDAAKLGMWLGSLLPNAANTITLNAAQGLTASAPLSTLWGTAGALVGSAVTADLVGATAGVKAGAYAGVWAGVAVSVEGKKDVAVTSSSGDVLVGADGAVDLSGQKAFLYGGSKTVVAAGNGSGLIATGGDVFVGMLDISGKRYEAGACMDGILVSREKVDVYVDKSHMKVTKSSMAIETKTYSVDASEVTISAKGRVLLG